MPIVDYNRIYHVRSRERQPVLYSPHMVPDRAGAFLRATAPGIRARLEAADARARERQGNLRAQYAALGNLIKVGGDVGETYARAVERRDQADFDALAAAWQTHMNAGAEQAYRRPYVRGGENGEGADGPMRAIEELDSSFDETDAFQNARDGVKERFAAWRAKSRIPYANKAAQRQSDLNDLYQKNALEARFASADGKIATFYGIGEDGSFNAAVEEKADAAVARTAWEYERVGAVLPESERARIAGGIREKALFDRAKFRCAQFAAGDTVPTEDDEALLSAARELSQDGSAITDDTMRLALKNVADAAEKSRNGNIERVANAAIDSANDILQKVQLGSVMDTELMGSMSSFADALENGRVPDRIKLPMLDKMDTALAVRRALAWEKDLKKLEVPPGTEATDEQRSAYLEKLKEIGTMPEKQKGILMRRLYGGTASGGGNAPRNRFTASDASFWLGRGEIGYALDQAEEAYKAGDMTDEDYFKTVDNCRKKAVFNKAVGDKGPDYVKAIYDAMDASFGGSFSKLVEMDQNGLPKVDEDGRLVLRYGRDETFSTRIRRSTGELYPAIGNGIPNWNALDITASALEAAFSAGMQHVTERLSGRGAKDEGPLTPDLAKAELREVFDNILQSQNGAVSSLALEQALREYREKHAWLGVNPLAYIGSRRAVEESHRYRPTEK